LRKPQDNGLFEDIVEYDHTKRLSAKTMFLTSLLEHLKDSYFVDGGNATKAGIIDYLFENRPQYLLIDEIDKLAPKDQTFLLNLMETRTISETKYGKTIQAEIKTSVFVTGNDPNKLSGALLSRFFVVDLEPYTLLDLSYSSMLIADGF